MINTYDIVYIINNDVETLKKIMAYDTFHLQYTAAVAMLRKLDIKDENTYLKYADQIEEFKDFSYLEVTTYDRFSNNDYFNIINTICKSQMNVNKDKKM